MNLKALKAQLTRAQKLKDSPEKTLEAVLKACEAALVAFRADYWPDCWADWQRALDDAWTEARYAGDLGNKKEELTRRFFACEEEFAKG